MDSENNYHRKVERKLFVVDDDESSRLLVSGILENSDISILESGCGKDALRLYKQYWKEIDLVLMDICLPCHDGWELLKLFRQVNAQVRAITLSAILPSQLAEMSQSAGFLTYMTKPIFHIEEFRQEILLYINSSSLNPEIIDHNFRTTRQD
jgi:CheY-like chemotaxis protein